MNEEQLKEIEQRVLVEQRFSRQMCIELITEVRAAWASERWLAEKLMGIGNAQIVIKKWLGDDICDDYFSVYNKEQRLLKWLKAAREATEVTDENRTK